MNLTYTQAKQSAELLELVGFDQAMFGLDGFGEEYWADPDLISIWIKVDGIKVGVIGLRRNVDVGETVEAVLPESPGTLYIESIAVLPEYQNRGIGTAAKFWITDVSEHRAGMTRVVSNVRADNPPSIAMNRKSGFRRHGIKRGYYGDGTDAIVFEYHLN